MSTLREVARRAGVSVATASRVATGDVRVRPHTRERVEQAMRELLYVPRRREPATGLIGILVPELSNPIFPALAQEIEMRATPAGFASILCDTMSAAYREVDYVHMLVDRGVAGMIFVSCEMTNLEGEHAHYRRLMDEGARIVFVNGTLNGFDVPSVGVDERAAGELATRHLIELGHRRIGFAAGPKHYLPTQRKAAGRGSALRAAGLEPDGLVAYADFDVQGGRAALAELLQGDDPPTGVICSSDVMAIGVLQEAAERGLHVPRDLSVVGFDGIAAEWTQPRLTTIEQPIPEIAETAVEALRRLIEEPARPLPHFVFRPQLRLGGSTAPPAT
ncbi:MAG TPA: LacI family DNA-binding transcriptional regulator [Gaiellaceae bacterium]|nr:LacI family DNA-binding transcriptional regulator [Gaiellaceae bacterium]